MYSRKCTSFLEPVLQSYFLVSGEFLTSISILEGTFLSKAMHSNVKQMASSQYFHEKLYNTCSIFMKNCIIPGYRCKYQVPFFCQGCLKSSSQILGEHMTCIALLSSLQSFLPIFLVIFFCLFFLQLFLPSFLVNLLVFFLIFLAWLCQSSCSFFLAGLSLSFFYFFGKPFFGFFFGLEKY